MYANTNTFLNLAFLVREVVQFMACHKLMHLTTIKCTFCSVHITKHMLIKYGDASLKIQRWIACNWTNNQDFCKYI
jgi:hypothetical protein